MAKFCAAFYRIRNIHNNYVLYVKYNTQRPFGCFNWFKHIFCKKKHLCYFIFEQNKSTVDKNQCKKNLPHKKCVPQNC